MGMIALPAPKGCGVVRRFMNNAQHRTWPIISPLNHFGLLLELVLVLLFLLQALSLSEARMNVWGSTVEPSRGKAKRFLSVPPHSIPNSEIKLFAPQRESTSHLPSTPNRYCVEAISSRARTLSLRYHPYEVKIFTMLVCYAESTCVEVTHMRMKTRGSKDGGWWLYLDSEVSSWKE